MLGFLLFWYSNTKYIVKPNYTNHPQMPYQSFFMNCVYKSCVRKCVLQQFRPCVKTWPMGLSRKQVPASEILMCSAGITGGCREDDGLPWTCRFTVFNQFRTFPTSPSAVSFFSFRIQPWSFWENSGLVLSRGQWARSLTSPLMLPRVGSKGRSRFLERSSTETAFKQWRRSTRKKGNGVVASIHVQGSRTVETVLSVRFDESQCGPS